jgi:hypothetical protein
LVERHGSGPAVAGMWLRAGRRWINDPEQRAGAQLSNSWANVHRTALYGSPLILSYWNAALVVWPHFTLTPCPRLRFIGLYASLIGSACKVIVTIFWYRDITTRFHC